MAVAVILGKGGAVARAHDGLALVGYQHHFAGDDVDEFIFQAVPVALAGPHAGLEGQEVDPKIGQPARIAQPRAMAVAAGNVMGRGITCAGADRRGGNLDLRHGLPVKENARQA
jgi:hypothetical protein